MSIGGRIDQINYIYILGYNENEWTTATDSNKVN